VSDEVRESSVSADVRRAYDRLMSAFADGSTDEYFSSFHRDASFLFPGESLLEGRSAYQEAWNRWHDEGVRFTDVVVRDVRVRTLGTTAVVTHDIETTTASNGVTTVDHERESIVFVLDQGRWLVVHEHLSAAE
jgi:uncharacterized protein (TIGR02246 family)